MEKKEEEEIKTRFSNTFRKYLHDSFFSFEKKKSHEFLLFWKISVARKLQQQRKRRRKRSIFRDFDEVVVSREHREERERERETLGGQVKNDCKIIDDCQPFLNPKRASRYVYTHDTDIRTRSSLSLHVRLIVVTGRGKRQRVSKIMAVHLFSRVGRARSYDDSGTNYLRLRINRLLSSESFPN